MSISRDDASRALGEIEGAHERLREITAYGYAAPNLIVWGVAWLVADLATQFGPTPIREWAWPAASLIATPLSIGVVIFAQRRARPTMSFRLALRVYGVIAAVFAFTAALIVVCWPLDPKQVHSLFGLIVGFAYVLEGLWLGWRMVALGLALVALTLVAYCVLPLYGGYLAFMGVVGGGALLLGGLWLRRI